MAKLYVVGTPIGNLGDLSHRALETLAMVEFIAAEDTRVSLKLLTHFGIQKPMLSYHQHNRREMGEKIVARILEGQNCAIITDAGMPCVSDPGEELVALCALHGVEVVVVPGPSAVIAALAISGLATGRFAFEGFLSTAKASRMQHLEAVSCDERTLIFYEAPHKLPATLQDMLTVFGDRKISLAREITKLHEEVLRTTLAQAVDYYQQTNPRGEFVLVVEGASPKPQEQPTLAEAVEMVRKLRQEGISPSQAAKDVAKETGYPKGQLYKESL